MLSKVFLEVFPFTAGEESINPASIFADYAKAVTELAQEGPNEKNDETLLNSSQRLFDSEVSRHSSFDSRASGLMAAIGLAATLVTGIGITTLNDAGGLPFAAYVTAFCVYIVVLVYLAVTSIIAFWVQGYVPRSTPDPTDLQPANNNGFQRTIACKILSYTIDNYKVNNRAAIRLYCGLKCFRNAVLALVLGGLAIAVISACFQAKRPDPSKLAQALALSAGCTDLPTLKSGADGGWKGSCAYNGRAATVTVTSEGAVSLKP